MQDFLVSVLHEPSHVDMFPQCGTVNKYQREDQLTSWLDIQNISPQPDILWTMDGQTIEAVTVIETDVHENFQDMQVVQTLRFLFHESFNGKNLEYRILLEVVDEFGNKNPSDNFIMDGSILVSSLTNKKSGESFCVRRQDKQFISD